MKYKNKRNQIRYKRARTKNTINSLKRSNRFKNRRKIGKKHKRVVTFPRRVGLLQYIFYAVLNTDIPMNRGTAAANIADGVLQLYYKLDADQVKSEYIDIWERNGRKIVVLKGYDHKHLKYLENEAKFLALGTHAVRQSWGRNRWIIVITAFGQREDMDEIFEGLTYLK